MAIMCEKCGRERDRHGRQHCSACHAVYMAERRKSQVKTPEQRKRASACSYANVMFRRGYLHRTPCCVCGSNETQLHHPDYDRPLYVFSLCKPHHIAWHVYERANPGAVFLDWVPPGSKPALIGLDPKTVTRETSASFWGHPRA